MILGKDKKMGLQGIISVNQLNPTDRSFERNFMALLCLQNFRTEIYNWVTPLNVLPGQCMNYYLRLPLSEWVRLEIGDLKMTPRIARHSSSLLGHTGG